MDPTVAIIVSNITLETTKMIVSGEYILNFPEFRSVHPGEPPQNRQNWFSSQLKSFSGKLNDMHCENYNVAFPMCEVYQETFPVLPEIDDWPSTGGCLGTRLHSFCNRFSADYG